MKEKIYLFDHAPYLRDEWDYEKNIGIDPEKLTYRSQKKAWFLCKNKHSLYSYIMNRAKGHKCGICTGFLVLAGYNDLLTLRPDIAKQLVNQELANKLALNSNTKVEWICEKGHKWFTQVYKRVSANRNCGVCVGQIVLPGYNDLATTNPELAKQLVNPSLAKTVTLYSGKKLEWICSKDHISVSSISNKAKGIGCGICVNQIILSGYNDLATTHPELIKELVNQELATTILGGSNKSVEWICKKGHRWFTKPAHRIAMKSGCPKCSFSSTSNKEKQLRNLLSKNFNTNLDHTTRVPVIWRKNKSMQIDILFELSIGFVCCEYDGAYYHNTKEDIDIEKTLALLNNKYYVIRIREYSKDIFLKHLEISHPNLLQISVKYDLDGNNLTNAVNQIKGWIEEKMKND